MVAAAAGLTVASPALALVSTPPFCWSGFALGASAEVTLYHPDPQAAQTLMHGMLQEILRLENIFSLYSPSSALYRLNRAGRLENPPEELVSLLWEAQDYGIRTQGGFDFTIQPLWQVYAKHFSTAGVTSPPSAGAIQQALALVDYRLPDISRKRIILPMEGMQLTLNGIAQGYITDKVSEWLKNRGMENMLVSLGEIRGLGTHPDGSPWHIGIHDPQGKDVLLATLPLKDRAIATSGGYGTPFTDDTAFHHVLHPGSGICPAEYHSLSVAAPTAAMADAFSTGLYVHSLEVVRQILEREPQLAAYIQCTNGESLRIRL